MNTMNNTNFFQSPDIDLSSISPEEEERSRRAWERVFESAPPFVAEDPYQNQLTMQQQIRDHKPIIHVKAKAFENSYTFTNLQFFEHKQLPTIDPSISYVPWSPESRGESLVYRFAHQHDESYIHSEFCADQLKYAYRTFKPIILPQLAKENFKMYATLEVLDFEKSAHINTGKAQLIRNLKELQDFFRDINHDIIQFGEGYNKPIAAIRSVSIYMNRYSPIRGGTYQELPEWISKKNKHSMCVLNVKNRDEQCFKWAILSMLHPVQRNRERVTHYKPFADELDFTGITFPVSIDDIPRFEKQNPHIAISAYETLNKEEVRPWRVSKYAGSDEKIHIPLLLHEGHWTSITNWNMLCSSADSQCKCCPRCLCRFNDKYDIAKHLETCNGFDCQVVKMPEKGSICKWNKFKGAHRLPICIYADFEAIQPACDIIDTEKNTQQTAEHKACSFSFFIDAPKDFNIGPRTYLYTGEDAATVFVDQLLEIEHKLKDQIRKRVPIYKEINEKTGKLKHEIQIPVCFHNAKGYDSHLITTAIGNIQDRKEEEPVVVQEDDTSCFLSQAKHYGTKGVQLTIDGKVAEIAFRREQKQRAKAVKYCATQTLLKPFASKPLAPSDTLDKPVLDKQQPRDMKLKALAESNQKFKTLSFNSYTILDTCAHLPSSLDKLVKNLPKEKKRNLRSLCTTKKQFDLVQQKLLIPYEKMTSFDWFSQKISTNKLDYYSSLNAKGATRDDMKTLKQVIKAFNLKTNRDLHDLYLRVDVMALADVFEAYRELAMSDYDLDPAAFIGTPSFAWAAMLKMTDVQLELLTDVDMYTFFEKAKRGGVSMAALRYAKANNPLLEDYDPEQKESYIWYGDSNNLYGHAMSQKLPQKDFRWGDADTFDPHADWSGSEGAFVEVDLEYPAHLHDLHSNLPLAPENIEIKADMLSGIQKKMCGGKLIHGNRKLTPHFNERKNYILHAENLKYYLEMGLKLKKVHRVVYFTQSAWLKPWIDFNTKKRKEAKNDFEKDYYKLMNNAVFGKTMQNVRGRSKVYFITTKSQYRKHTGRPSYKYTMDYGSENFRIVFEESPDVLLDQPIYAGASILDLSKLVMYKFHYGVMQPKFGLENVKLLMTDTDSLMYFIQTDSFYEKLQDISEHLDTSDYPVDHPLYSIENKKKIGKFKDETNSVPISEACCLRAKCYWYKEAKEHLKCKGVKKSAAAKLAGEDFKAALQGKDKFVTFQSLRSYDHRIYTESIQKKALSRFDDKRFMCEDLIHTRPHGHWRNV